jgi:hypothetical protein
MADLDALIQEGKALRKPLDVLGKVLNDKSVVEYIAETKRQRAAVVEKDKELAPTMQKIRRLVEGDDMRFHHANELVQYLESYDATLSAIHRLDEGEKWIESLTSFEPPHCHDWLQVVVGRFLAQLREYFGGVHAGAASLQRCADLATYFVDQAVFHNPYPIVKNRATGFYEPVMPKRSERDHKVWLNNPPDEE